MRKVSLILMMVIFIIFYLFSSSAYSASSHNEGDRTGYDEQMTRANGKQCQNCHAFQTFHTSGPHGGYTITTDKCTACHTIHKADNASLLPGTTVTGTCNFCHDLTQSEFAPYYMSFSVPEDEETSIKSAHWVEGIPDLDSNGESDLDDKLVRTQEWAKNLIIPGGDPTDFGEGDLNTSNQGELSGDKFTCNSCHTPHAIEGSTVAPFLSETKINFGADGRFWLTDKLLKSYLNGSTEPVEQYSSDWCAACHKGRYEIGEDTEYHNHPVAMIKQHENDPEPARTEALKKAMGYQFLDYASYKGTWDKARILQEAKNGRDNGTYPTFLWSATDDTAVFTADPRTNKVFAMSGGDPLDENRPRPDGDVDYDDYKDIGPSCQQCHGNARDVEESYQNNLTDEDKPLRTTFPHVTTNQFMLVEHGDDLCTNCHGLRNLP